jgi:hypothetical protein
MGTVAMRPPRNGWAIDGRGAAVYFQHDVELAQPSETAGPDRFFEE